MPESLLKVPQESPVARAGAGDISERELTRERYKLQTTPPARVQPAHPKKQLYSAPVNKFTMKITTAPSPNLARIRSCLDEYALATPAKVCRQIRPKAISMEDLSPARRVRRERKCKDTVRVRSPGLHSIAEEAAAARIGRFMLASAWRRRREDVRRLRKTLETQVSCSERLRMQVATLKALLDSDNAKVRMAMKELDRLKQMLRDKDIEKAVLEREKQALENDICAAEDRASEFSIGWRNCRNELEGVRAAGAVCEHALAAERALADDLRAQRDEAMIRLESAEEEIEVTEVEMNNLKRELLEKIEAVRDVTALLAAERESRAKCARECSALTLRASLAGEEARALSALVSALRGDLARARRELGVVREQLDWWPRPLTRMLGVARSWLRRSGSLPEAVLWALVPARHGC